jgi:hypothetical protein
MSQRLASLEKNNKEAKKENEELKNEVGALT